MIGEKVIQAIINLKVSKKQNEYLWNKRKTRTEAEKALSQLNITTAQMEINELERNYGLNNLL